MCGCILIRAGNPKWKFPLIQEEAQYDMIMKRASSMLQAAFGRTVVLAGISFAVCAAMAEPVTYTGFTIADGKLGQWAFHNARVYLTFKGDTKDVKFIQPYIDPSHPEYGTVDIWINQTGKASVTIISGQRVVSANFGPNQIFVSSDLGDTPKPSDPPHLGARGVGFGSFTAAGGFEPTYPLAIEDGPLDWGDILNGGFPSTFIDGAPSPEMTQLSVDLVHSTRFGGRGWVCVGFPVVPCSPANALHTDRGDLYLSMPYSQAPNFDQGETLNAGFFVAEVGESAEGNISAQLTTSHAAGSPNTISYYGYLISDVTLGSNHYAGAQIYLSMDSVASKVVAFSSGHGFRSDSGSAHVTIVSGQRVTLADFEPGQIYVYYDIDHAIVGFGSKAGNGSRESGYPLSITANQYPQDSSGLVENSLVGAVSDLTLTPAHASNYTLATSSLQTDLKNATVLNGGASSCQGFDPATSTCSGLTPIPLRTNRGDFLLFEPYRHDATKAGEKTYSVNWGLFWAEPGPARNE